MPDITTPISGFQLDRGCMQPVIEKALPWVQGNAFCWFGHMVNKLVLQDLSFSSPGS
jgi:hypothetical protein